MTIFEKNNYRDIIRQKISDSDTPRGHQARLAEAAGCHSSYISLVLKGNSHLSLDQAYAFAEFWNLDDVETQYFLTLVNYERAESEKLRMRLNADIERLRENVKQPQYRSKRLMPEYRMVEVEDSTRFFSEWYYSAIREALSISSYQTPADLVQRFQLPPKLIEHVLKVLEDMNLAAYKDGRWLPVAGNTSLTNDSDMSGKLFLATVRQRAMQMTGLRPYFKERLSGVHFGHIFTIHKKDLQEINEIILEAIKRVLDKSKKAEEEPDEVVCFSGDFFVI